MRTQTRILALLLSGVLAGSALAAHITDKLVVGMYAQASPEGSPLKLLSSGTPIEVLQTKDGYTQVRLADDTEGWVSSSYITEEKPAKAMLAETQAKLRQMGIELAALREKQVAESDAQQAAASAKASEREGELSDSLEKAEARVAELEAELDSSLGRAQERVAELEQQLSERPAVESVMQQTDDLQQRVDQAVRLLGGAQAAPFSGSMSPADENPLVRHRYWIIGGVALLLGFIAGGLFVDYRFRRRHGGFRF